MQEAKRLGSDVTIPRSDKLNLGSEESNFVSSSEGPLGIFGAFEDGHETGWFYLFDARLRKIVKCAHIYNSSNASVGAEDVDVVWDASNAACGVAVRGQFRAFLGLAEDLELRKPIVDRNMDGVYADDWTPGFERYLQRGN